MASRLSAKQLVENVMRFLTVDTRDTALQELVKEAIIQADRELRECDSLSPLAWDIVPYDGIRTTIYAEITDVTAANPGVITAASSDSSITGHGFRDNSSGHQDIIIIDSLDEPEELNGRAFLLEYIDPTTFSLKTLDGINAIDTSGYTAYSSGGVAYHAGIVLNSTTVLTGISNWDIKKILPNPTFSGYPTDPISENAVRHNHYWTDVSAGQRPKKYRYWQHHVTAVASPTILHYLLWYPPCDNEYNLFFNYQKEIDDISAWDATTYPFHPAEAHDALWHGALANLVGLATRVKRQSDRNIATQLEVLFAQRWLGEWENDKARVRKLSREMLGDSGGLGGFTA